MYSVAPVVTHLKKHVITSAVPFLTAVEALMPIKAAHQLLRHVSFPITRPSHSVTLAVHMVPRSTFSTMIHFSISSISVGLLL